MKYTLKEKKALPRSEYLLVLEIPAEGVSMRQKHVLDRLKKDTELPGFRKGFVPEHVIRGRMGDMALWEKAAIDALGEALSIISREEKLSAIGMPRVEVLKLAPNNPAEFKITLSLYPELKLPDYKKIAAVQNGKKTEPINVEEKEMDTVIAEMKKQHEVAVGEKDFAVTDEIVGVFGPFKTVADFRAKVKEGLLSRKEARGREKKRAELLDILEEKSEGEIPDILVESELSRMESELQAEIERIGGSFEEYLKETKKDREALRKEWGKDAKRRARLQLVLFQIAKAEKIQIDEKQIEDEVKHLLEHYKKASPENARNYVEMLFMNQKVLEFLEGQK